MKLCRKDVRKHGVVLLISIFVLTVEPTWADRIVVNEACVSSNADDPELDNNCSSATTTIEDVAEVTLSGTAAPHPVLVNEKLTFTFDIFNDGPSDATNAILTADCPTASQFLSATSSDATCSFDDVSQTVTCTFSDALAAETGSRVTLEVIATDAAMLSSTATVLAEETSPVSITLSADAVCDLPGGADGSGFELHLENDRMVRGLETTLTVVDALPGEVIEFYYSSVGQGCSPCLTRLGGLCLNLDDAAIRLSATTTADELGTAELSVPIDPSFPLDEVWVQAMVERGDNGIESAKSNVIHPMVLPPAATAELYREATLGQPWRWAWEVRRVGSGCISVDIDAVLTDPGGMETELSPREGEFVCDTVAFRDILVPSQAGTHRFDGCTTIELTSTPLSSDTLLVRVVEPAQDGRAPKLPFPTDSISDCDVPFLPSEVDMDIYQRVLPGGTWSYGLALSGRDLPQTVSARVFIDGEVHLELPDLQISTPGGLELPGLTYEVPDTTPIGTVVGAHVELWQNDEKIFTSPAIDFRVDN